MNRISYRRNRIASGLALVASVLFFNATALAEINIGGDVYGGGKNGAVGTANLHPSVTDTSDPDNINLSDRAIALLNDNSHAASVVVNSGNVRTVFGGGQNGRVYGLTLARINGGTIGAPELEGTVHGGVFGGGDGPDALVFGMAHVMIKGGTIWNNVYGGGNQADLIGPAATRLDAGIIYGNVFGSARMADLMGYCNVDIASDPLNTNPLYVKAVYGGNDISGMSANLTKVFPNVTRQSNPTWTWINSIPSFTGKATTVYNGTAQWKPYKESSRSVTYGSITVQVKSNLNGAINTTNIWNNTITSHSVTGKSTFVGNLFAGGNGDYTYTDGTVTLPEDLEKDSNGNYLHTVTFGSARNMLSRPNTERAYLQIEGGTFGYIYGGGNNATVTASTDIYIDNPDAPCLVPASVVGRMGVQKSSYKFVLADGITPATGADNAVYARFEQTMDRVFGGNNLADMSIQPNWYLHGGRINSLYGGGNKGNMTCNNGILVNIFKYKPGVDNNGTVSGSDAPSSIKVNNLYGGCRMADVAPADNQTAAFTRFGHDFPADYSSRVYITGGTINNVYGGNDISGHVYKGADVEIYGAVSGDVYGGGNGAYPYTDNKALALASPEEWGDYYYAADGTANGPEALNAEESLTGLNLKRPHVESTMVHIAGSGEWISPADWESEYGAKSAGGAVAKLSFTDGHQLDLSHGSSERNQPGYLLAKGEMRDINRVYVLGGVYCGGNSATLKNESGQDAKATLRIGQCVTIDRVFLGSNGEKMISEDLLGMYAGGVTLDGINYPLARFNLTQSTDMARYMEGCAVNIMPSIEYDNLDNNDDVSINENADMDPEGLNFSSRIGSFFCGGNVGSITVDGTIGQANGLEFPRELVIFDKVVGGCNNANVPYREGINAFFQGGVTGAPGDKAKDAKGNVIDNDRDPGVKIQLYVPCRMEPRYLAKTMGSDGFWQIDMNEPEPWSAPVVISDFGIESDTVGTVQILDRGNIYGGCYQSGYVNGSVQIDIKDELCATAQMRAYFGDRQFQGQKAGQDGTAAIVDNMRRYVLNHGWSVFGGGFGLDTEIWGNTYLNLSRNAGYINAYGGSQLGFIGRMERNADGSLQTEKATVITTGSAQGNSTTISPTSIEIDKYKVVQAYDTYFNLRNDIHRSPVSIFGLNALYGGGYQGVVTGNTHMYAGGGLHYDVFGGACNADIYGYTEVFVGRDLEGEFSNNLQLRHCVYGGNDFGGQILGTGEHTVTFTDETGSQKTRTVLSNTYVQYLGGTIERDLYGGSCGLYRYNDTYKWPAGSGIQQFTVFNSDGSTDVVSPVAGQEYRLYPENSWITLPTLYGSVAQVQGKESYNTFVDIACSQDVSTDIDKGKMGNTILGNIYGGGYGFCDQIGRVDTRDTYVVLHGPEGGTNRLADKVFGGGYFSYVANSTVDAVSGRVRNIYGGTSGTTVDAAVANSLMLARQKAAREQKTTWGTGFDQEEYEVLSEIDITQLIHADYTSSHTTVNVYPQLRENEEVNVYGAGAYTGADQTVVNLYGGLVNEVYGGSDQEGVCGNVTVNVPAGSAVVMNALYGGGHGSYQALPCDVRNATINFNSNDAVVKLGNIYGGNNYARATRNTFVNYNAKAKDGSNHYLNIYGAGNGAMTVSGRTHVNISGEARVLNVYGGGNEGSVFYKYDILKDSEHDASAYARYMVHDNSHTGLSYAHWYETYESETIEGQTVPVWQTNVSLVQGAIVDGSVCGAGYGSSSVVAGHTLVECNGATVTNDIFGGGYNGDVRKMLASDTGYRPEDYEMIIQSEEERNIPRYNSNSSVSTTIRMNGGTVRNLFGGGYVGKVGTPDEGYTATTNVILGKEVFDLGAGKVLFEELTAEVPAQVEPTLLNGDPAVRLSVYGAGDRGPVYGSSYTTLYNGHVGFVYDETSDTYMEYLTTEGSENPTLYAEDGNVYGAGFGENAQVLNSEVRMYDGVIRNSLYGGGEIGTVGWGTMSKDATTGQVSLVSVDKPGVAMVFMYGGLVQADVFGGGRGYSFDNYGQIQYGTKYFADGYVFGRTDCNIFRGQIGTATTMLSENGSHGNVFGGGNIGYVYSGDGLKWTSSSPDDGATGYYYLKNGNGFASYNGNRILTEDARVKVKVYGRAKEDITFQAATLHVNAGQRIPADVYDKLGDADKAKVMPGVYLATADIDYTFPTEFHIGDYIPNETLNTLSRSTEIGGRNVWDMIDLTGVTIHNAVFAGGNVSEGSDRIYAYSKTVFGNATASLVDVYCRDMVSVGSDGVGGLYGDGNLTFVDGYRELNVTNYGTDYYSLTDNITETNFNSLSQHEQAFYSASFRCKGGSTAGYNTGDVIQKAVWDTFSPQEKSNWELVAAVINKGRFLNTIQRADYCGLKGSRLILNGAEDRAQSNDDADYTKYSINRVGELSLNRNAGTGSNAVSSNEDDREHGSYFGIYNSVNYLGAMSSDYDFFAGLTGKPSQRTTTADPGNTKMFADISKDYIGATSTYTPVSGSIAYGGNHYSFFNWKADNYNKDIRNNGNCKNELALASGVFLELKREPEPGSTESEYGPIIGVIQLDLLNASPGEGGGYVYAANNHGTPNFSTQTSYASILSDDNQGLKTVRGYTYTPATDAPELGYNGIVTSGNFVNPLKTILDDCYPVAGNLTEDAHYWYIKGNVYVYDQLISAYTGMSKTYQAEMSLPLGVSGKTDAKLRLVNILPGLYADPSAAEDIRIAYQGIEKKYAAGDPISFWDWYNMPGDDTQKKALQQQFYLNTYVCTQPVRLGNGTVYSSGQSVIKSTYDSFGATTGTLLEDDGATEMRDENGSPVTGLLTGCFSPANEVSHANGYTLTLDMSNPQIWDDHYINVTDGTIITKSQWNAVPDEQKKDYLPSATFLCTASTAGTFGQKHYKVDDIVSAGVYAEQTEVLKDPNLNTEMQATFKGTYVARQDCKIGDKDYKKGTAISEDEYDRLGSEQSSFEEAYICVNTFQLSEKDYRVLNQIIGRTEYDAYSLELKNNFSQAYYCTKEGLWGGKYFASDRRYSGLDYSRVQSEERGSFEYSYDALDLLVTSFRQADGSTLDSDETLKQYLQTAGAVSRSEQNLQYYNSANGGDGVYSREVELDMETAKYVRGEDFTYLFPNVGRINISVGAPIPYDMFCNLPNDRRHYSSFTITPNGNSINKDESGNDKGGPYVAYVLNEPMTIGNVIHARGYVINPTEYNSLSDSQKHSVTMVKIDQRPDNAGTTYYYCNSAYTLGEKDSYVENFHSQSISSVSYTSDNGTVAANTFSNGSQVPQGTLLTNAEAAKLANYQAGFSLSGRNPQVETTLYVPASSDILALSKDRYVTVIYEYEYTESDAEGESYETTIERHVINVRLKFESDQPVIGQVVKPDVVLPLEHITVTNPSVIPGAFDVISGGWEIYTNMDDAVKHRNGRRFDNGLEDAYWFQNDYWVAYYAETKLGRTFSEPVQVSVANYHRILDITPQNSYLYIDHKDMERKPRIYIGYDLDAQGNTLTGADKAAQLAALKSLFNEINDNNGINNTSTGYTGQEYERKSSILNAGNLEFVLAGDIDMTGMEWVPVGDNDTHCFQGNLHGNGHTIMGIDKSLFGHLCGNVYNLGVIGGFQGSGIADHGSGRAENCWVWTTATPESGTDFGYAVMGDVITGNGENQASVINCYYPAGSPFKPYNSSYSGLQAFPRSVNDFINGEVAYDLNRFYLEARYARGINTLSDEYDKRANDSYTRKPDETFDTHTAENGQTVKTVSRYSYDTTTGESGIPRNDFQLYESFGRPALPDGSSGHNYGYVEAYYADGDFRYAQGLKPSADDIRATESKVKWNAVYPDDYIFFGQKLVYGLYPAATHNLHPVVAAKEPTFKDENGVNNSQSGLLVSNRTKANENNRLYRAPAYFSSSAMNTVTFNRQAAFRDMIHVVDMSLFTDADQIAKLTESGFLKADGYVPVTAARNSGNPEDMTTDFTGTPYSPHNGLTAIDFTGSGDSNPAKVDYKTMTPYKPLLDYEGLTDFRTDGLTQNLLVYVNEQNAETAGTDAGTYAVLEAAMPEPEFNNGTLPLDKYNNVAVVNTDNTSKVRGHIVDRTSNGSYTSTHDHFLVDRQDFNCPIEYTFNDESNMWYQRKPANYASANDAWETIVLPFTAKCVTTQQKGEITHFYGDDQAGHEYWLRDFHALKKESGDLDIATADFRRPAQGSQDLSVDNTFLWDYYYNDASGISRKDANSDEYQQYYSESREYPDYAFLTEGVPYIIAFPGERYYEFDMSGRFIPQNTASKTWSRLDAQTVTFVSGSEATIHVSDMLNMYNGHALTANPYKSDESGPARYLFTGTFLNATPAAGDSPHYAVNASGTEFSQVTANDENAAYVPFRAYFNVMPPASSPAPLPGEPTRSILVRSILIGSNGNPEHIEEQPAVLDKGIIIYGMDNVIWFESTLDYEVTVPLYAAGGQLIRYVNVPADSKVSVTVSATGIYMAGSTKVLVK